MASLLSAAPVIGLPLTPSQAKPHPVKSQRHAVRFIGSSVASMRIAKGATQSAQRTPRAPDPIDAAVAGAVTAVQDVPGGLAVVGVTWPGKAVTANDQFQIRTLTASRWSQWQTLDVDDSHGPDGAEATEATRGTSPYVVTGASKFEVRALTTDPTAPAEAAVQVVDPGTSLADNVQQAPASLGEAAAATAKPTIYTRQAWGAEALRKGVTPTYGEVRMGFVHHTDSTNTYTAVQVPAMIRGIYAYHVQTLGWSDIGYNFLIDRFGRTWEGRSGGMDKAVVGAQTLNYNSVSTGVSAIGNFENTGVPQVVTDAYKRIFAWKFSLTGIPATGTVPSPRPPSSPGSTATYFQRISGHRDGFQTSCPGKNLYAKLPEIRAGAVALIGAQPRSSLKRDVDRNGAPDAFSYSASADGLLTGGVSLLASAAREPVRRGVVVDTGWNALRNASLSPDLSGDGKADIVAQDPAAGSLRIYLGNGQGGIAGVRSIGSGWNVMSRILAARDRNGDGRNDLLATKTNGDLIYYAGNGAGGFASGRVVGTGWNSVGSITTAGDLNGDQIPDLLATRKSDGVQMMYAGRSDGSLHSRVQWGTGWGQFSTVVGGSDLDGDRDEDVYARLGGGMSTYSSDATGHLSRYTRWGSGWGSYTQLSTGSDWNGDGVADLLAVNPALAKGTLKLYAGIGKRDFQTRLAALPAVPGADLLRLVGDIDADGYVDALARIRTNDTLVLLRGQAGSRFGAPVRVGTGWNAFTLVEAAGDHDYDGVPDVLARDAHGNLFVYPITGNLTFKTRIAVGTGFQGMLSVVGAGAFDGDNRGDLIALRATDHALILYQGNGAAALQGAVILRTGQNDLAQLLGVGDYNGDSKADFMARAGDGRLWLYPGDGKGAVASRQPVRGGEGAGHLLG
jgi:hypothetical protein